MTQVMDQRGPGWKVEEGWGGNFYIFSFSLLIVRVWLGGREGTRGEEEERGRSWLGVCVIHLAGDRDVHLDAHAFFIHRVNTRLICGSPTSN